MRIGQHILPNNVFLAPMAGVTDLPFRQICRQLGAGMVVGEMTACSEDLRHTIKSINRGVHLSEPEPRSIQIVGWDPKMMARAAIYNVEQGASIIDINMGCPAKKVCQKLAGSALLGDEKAVASILAAVVGAVTVPVTLKIRTGTDPENRNGVAIAKLAECEGISLLAVHGRTRACKYIGDAEYKTIKEIKAAVSIPVVVNGDLNSMDKIRRVLDFTHADGVMIGRGAHGAPWFPGQVARYLQSRVKEPNFELSIQRKIVLTHLDDIYSFYGCDRGVRIARKHIKWYTENFPENGTIRKLINSEESPKRQLGLVSDYYFKLQNYLQAA